MQEFEFLNIDNMLICDCRMTKIYINRASRRDIIT